jgi:hypothetical protein
MLQKPPTNGMTGFMICNGLLLIRAENTRFALQTSNYSFDSTFEVSLLDFAMMLWACRIEPGKDESGNVIERACESVLPADTHQLVKR